MPYFSPYNDIDFQVYIDESFLSQCKDSLLYSLHEHDKNNTMNIIKTYKGAILLIDVPKNILILIADIIISYFDYEVFLNEFFDYKEYTISISKLSYDDMILRHNKNQFKKVILAFKLFDIMKKYNINNDFKFYRFNSELNVDYNITQHIIIYKLNNNYNNYHWRMADYRSDINSKKPGVYDKIIYHIYCHNNIKKAFEEFDIKIPNKLT